MMWRRSSVGWLGTSLLSFAMLFSAMALFEHLSPGRSTAQAQEALEQPAGDAAAQPAGEAAQPQSQSWLGWLVGSLGWLYSIVFLILSFCLVAVIVMNCMAIRRERMMPEALVQVLEANLEQKRYQEAYEAAKADDSFLGKVISAGLAKLSGGYEQATQAMQETGADETMKLEHQLNYINLIAQIGPMFGLLGTVDGMVQAFDVISKSAQTPKPNELAQGIGTALVTTVVGLWIAIPSISFFTIMRARLARLLFDTGLVAEGIMKRFSGVAAKKA